jgi:hypothetical protein
VTPQPAGAPIGERAAVLPDGTAVVGDEIYPVHVREDCERVQRYVAGTPVVETVFVTVDGATGVTDLLWEGGLHRVVTPYTGVVEIEVEGPVAEGDGRRQEALLHWWRDAPTAAEPERELRALSAALAAACRAQPGARRPTDEVDELGLWRLPGGAADLGAHAAFAAGSP